MASPSKFNSSQPLRNHERTGNRHFRHRIYRNLRPPLPMKELLTIITIGAVIFAFAAASYEVVTMWQTRRKPDRLAANQRRASQDLEAMRSAAK